MDWFSYPKNAHERRHGPEGYVRYNQYKDWLRDDFLFRCVYCLCRERWYPNGDEGFSVEHILPKSSHPELENVYENLVYACTRCNIARGMKPIPDPCLAPFELAVQMDGSVISACGATGEKTIDVCNLNEPTLVAFRKHVIESINDAREFGRTERLDYWLGYPLNMPNLTRKTKCVNKMTGSAETCYFMLHEQGKLHRHY